MFIKHWKLYTITYTNPNRNPNPTHPTHPNRHMIASITRCRHSSTSHYIGPFRPVTLRTGELSPFYSVGLSGLGMGRKGAPNPRRPSMLRNCSLLIGYCYITVIRVRKTHRKIWRDRFSNFMSAGPVESIRTWSSSDETCRVCCSWWW